MKRIIISVTNDITTDQRVAKVCNALLEMNYAILLIGRKLPSSQSLQRKYDTKRFKLFFNKGFLFYAEFNLRLFFFLICSKKDILLSNDLDTLLPNFLVSKLQNKKLVYDSHELFPEIPELVERPRVKKAWESLENFLLPKIKNCYTVSNSIADFYQNKYRANFKVIRNVPVSLNNISVDELPFQHTNKKILLYQGAINIGRGLELIIDTMPLLENCLLIIAGKGDIFEKLQQKVASQNLHGYVHFLGNLPPEKLQKITPLADVGFSLEEDIGLSYRYCLPNKLFDYIQAEVPVIVSDLPEMKTIVNKYQIGNVLSIRTPEELAKKINSVLNSNFSFALKKAKEELVWEKEKLILQHIFNNLV